MILLSHMVNAETLVQDTLIFFSVFWFPAYLPSVQLYIGMIICFEYRTFNDKDDHLFFQEIMFWHLNSRGAAMG